MSELTLDVGLANKLKVAFARNGWTQELIDTACEGDKLGQFRQVLLGQATIQHNPLNTTVNVDRSVRPPYPDWVKEVLHPELELTGPSGYNLSAVQLWLHDGQKNGNGVRGQKIYEYLRDNDGLVTCLGRADGIAIQNLGIEVFRQFFKGKYVYLWKSVVRDRNGRLFVPCLYGSGGGVGLAWSWLNLDFSDDDPAARLAS